MVLELIIAATALVSLISLAGLALFVVSRKTLEQAMFYMIIFSTGSLLGAAFFDLIPESMGGTGTGVAMEFVFFGLVATFVMEKIIHWHHHHHIDHKGEHHHPLGILTMVGDAFHNFFDGVAISAAFIVSVPLGVTTTIAVAFHEIPHEIGNFTLLIYSGYSRSEAIVFNFVTALTAIAGGLLFYFFSGVISHFESYALAFTAGTFIYIAGVDLLPELHKEKGARNSLLQLIFMLSGAAVIWLVARFLE